MTVRKTTTALVVGAMACIGTAAQANGSLILRNETGLPLYYSVEDIWGRTIPGGTGCLDIAPSVTLFGPAYANRELVVVQGYTTSGARGSNCGGSTIARTGNVQPTRILARVRTMTFTMSNQQLQVR